MSRNKYSCRIYSSGAAIQSYESLAFTSVYCLTTEFSGSCVSDVLPRNRQHVDCPLNQ